MPMATGVSKELTNHFAVAEDLSRAIAQLEDIDYFFEKIEQPYINKQLDACKASTFSPSNVRNPGTRWAAFASASSTSSL